MPAVLPKPTTNIVQPPTAIPAAGAATYTWDGKTTAPDTSAASAPATAIKIPAVSNNFPVGLMQNSAVKTVAPQPARSAPSVLRGRLG
jgi:hypothetical protein